MDAPAALAAINQSKAALAESLAALDRAQAALTATDPALVVVRAGQDLQAALDRGGLIGLEAATWTGTYTLRSGTQLTGRAGSAIYGVTGPALIIPPGARGVAISTLEATSDGEGAVILIGENSPAQTTVEQAPAHITLTAVRIPWHKGKRGIENHGIDVSLIDCDILEVWDWSPARRDSQAVYTENTPGPMTVRRGRYSAGSEVFLFGGAAKTFIQGVVPADVLLDSVEILRPPSWRTDGQKRKIKNCVEGKNVERIRLVNCHIHGCWYDGYQDGYAFVFTPALDGDIVNPPLQSGTVRDVTIEDCNVHDVANGFQIMGRHYSSFTPDATTNIVVRRLTLTASAAYGKPGEPNGYGRLATITGEPGAITFEDCPTVTDGSSLILYDPGDVLDPQTKQVRRGGRIGALTLTGCRANLGEYGLMLGGHPLARNWRESVDQLKVTGNTFGGPVMPDLPDNTYVPPFTA